MYHVASMTSVICLIDLNERNKFYQFDIDICVGIHLVLHCNNTLTQLALNISLFIYGHRLIIRRRHMGI